LCLQETKCIDDAFSAKRFKRLGYEHIALNGQKGYHGVAIISKLPFEKTDIRTFCDKIDYASRLGRVRRKGPGSQSRWCCIISTCRPAAIFRIPTLNPKFEHKLRFLDEMKACEPLHPRGRRSPHPGRRPQCGAI